nr:RNA-directed DNA polymerase, eukaryota [Tanacetum cinerariifolium]
AKVKAVQDVAAAAHAKVDGVNGLGQKYNIVYVMGSSPKETKPGPTQKAQPAYELQGSINTLSSQLEKGVLLVSFLVSVCVLSIDNDIYSTVDACPNACEMWKAIERLKQGILKDLFPRIYALEMCKDVNIRTKLEASSLETSLRRNVRGGAEQAQLTAVSKVSGNITLAP